MLDSVLQFVKAQASFKFYCVGANFSRHRFKREMWEKIANDLQMPWRAVEARHWELGAEGLAVRAGVPLFSSNSSSTVSDNSNMAATNMTLHTRHSSSSLNHQMYPYGASPQNDMWTTSNYTRRRERSPVHQPMPQHPQSFAYHNYAPYPSRPDPYQLPQLATNPAAAAPPQHRNNINMGGMPPASAPQYITSRPRSDSPTLGSYGSGIPPTSSSSHRAPSSSSTSASASPYESPHFAQGERLPPMRMLTEPSGQGHGGNHGPSPQDIYQFGGYRGR